MRFFHVLIMISMMISHVSALTPELESSLTPEELNYLQEHPILRVHNETRWAPMNFYENGQAQGFSIDYMNLLASKLGISVNYVSGPTWNEFLTMMKTEKLDVMLNIVQSKNREKFLRFTNIYKTLDMHIYSHASRPYPSLRSLKGKKLAIPQGYIQAELIKQYYPAINIQLYHDLVECAQAVQSQEADAFITLPPVANYVIQKHALEQVIESGQTRFIDNRYNQIRLRLAVPLDQPLLQSILNKTMKTINYQEMQQLDKHWLLPSLESNIPNSESSSTQTIPKPDIDLSVSELSYLYSKQHITMCIAPGWPPIDWIDKNGHHQGLSASFVKLFSDKLHIPFVTLKAPTWQESLQNLRQERCDFISSIIKTPERATYLNFTDVYFQGYIAIATYQNAPPMSDPILQLRDKKIGAVKESGFEKEARKIPGIHLVSLPNILTGLKMVQQGELDGVIDNHASIHYLIQQHNLWNLKIAGYLPSTLDIRFGMTKQNTTLTQIFNQLLHSIPPEEKHAITTQWIKTDQKEKKEVSLPYTAFLMAILFLLLIWAAWYVYSKFARLNKKLAEAIIQRQKSENLFKGVIENIQEGFWVIDQNGSFTYANERIKTQLGYEPEEIIGRLFSDFLPPIPSSKEQMFFNRLLTHPAPFSHFVHNSYHKNNTLVTLESNGVPFYDPDGSLLGYRGVSRNITDQIEAKKQNEKEHEKLLEAEKIAALNQLVSGVAHEINTPIGTIYTASTAIQKELGQLSIENYRADLSLHRTLTKLQEGLSIITHNIKRVNSTIQSFKRISVDQHQDRLASINLREYVQDIINTLGHSTPNKSYRVILSEGESPHLTTYPGTLAQILTHLISNSEKHAFEGVEDGIIEIGFKELGETVYLIYSDNGNGIPEPLLKKVFEPFFTTDPKDGTGLGMHMVYNLVHHKLHGDIAVENGKSSGIVITISFPKQHKGIS